MQFPDPAWMSSAKHFVGRAMLLIAIVALHLLLVFWLAGRPRPEATAPPAVLNVFTVSRASGYAASAPPARPEAASPPHPIPVGIVHRPSPPATNSPSFTAADMAQQAAGTPGGCALARGAGDAIGHDMAAMAELDALPPTIRSSADAVMLWNGQWLDQGAMPEGSNAGALRRVVEQLVTDASVECRDAESAGPVFIPISERDHTVMIVIGSGVWRWADLLTSPTPCTLASVAPCPRVEAPFANDQPVK